VRPQYLAAFLGALAGAFLIYYTCLFSLLATGNLPPPAFTNSICADEKIEFIRQHPPESPNLLVIGSSVAWRHFDGATLVRDAPVIRPFNGAFCGLHAGQSAYAANWLLDRLPSVRDVLLIATPQDFGDCTTEPATFFDRQDVDSYVFRHTSPWWFYTRYFALGSLLRNSAEIADKRSGKNQIDPLVFDRYGSGPLNTSENRGRLLYGDVKGQDPACFAALASLSARLRQDGRRLMVATTPLHPLWKAQYDPQGLMLARFNNDIRTALNANGGQYWDSNASFLPNENLFFDAIHLRWAAVPDFTGALVEALGFDSASETFWNK
jgi:hypothetical protein